MAVHRNEDGVAVSLGPRGLAGADIAAGTGHVLHIELPAELLRQFLRDQAGAASVGPPAANGTITRTGRAG